MNRYANIFGLELLILLIFLHGVIYAQIAPDDSTQIITIGELEGRIDMRSLTQNRHRSFYFLTQAQQPEDFDYYTSNRKSVLFRVNHSGTSASSPRRWIRYKFFESEWSLISALIVQKIDFARLISEESAREIVKSNRAIHLLPELLPNHTVTMLSFNCRHPVWNRIEVRTALSYAIDKTGIVEELLKKRADLARGPFNREFDAYESSLEEFQYNPKRAIKLLNENGWIDANNDGILEDRQGNPLKLKLLYRQGLVLDEQLIRWIKINWNQIGIDVVPRPVNYTNFQRMLFSGQFDVALLEHQFEEDVASLEAFFSDQLPSNFSGYSSSRLQNYFRLYHGIDDPARRKILIQSIQKVLNQEQPAIFLYFKWLVFNFINRNRIQNYLDDSGNLRPISEWDLK